MSTYFPKEGDIARKWFVVDASGLPLGRLASRVARILMGKESPKYTPFIDTGDHVVIVNAEKIKVTGMKADQKMYQDVYKRQVHGGTFADGFHAAEDLDGVGGVVAVGGFAVLLRIGVLRVVLSVHEFGVQFFCGHSAPWRKPDHAPGWWGRFRS